MQVLTYVLLIPYFCYIISLQSYHLKLECTHTADKTLPVLRMWDETTHLHAADLTMQYKLPGVSCSPTAYVKTHSASGKLCTHVAYIMIHYHITKSDDMQFSHALHACIYLNMLTDDSRFHVHHICIHTYPIPVSYTHLTLPTIYSV